jgi:hypothetical protein
VLSVTKETEPTINFNLFRPHVVINKLCFGLGDPLACFEFLDLAISDPNQLGSPSSLVHLYALISRQL